MERGQTLQDIWTDTDFIPERNSFWTVQEQMLHRFSDWAMSARTEEFFCPRSVFVENPNEDATSKCNLQKAQADDHESVGSKDL